MHRNDGLGVFNAWLVRGEGLLLLLVIQGLDKLVECLGLVPVGVAGVVFRFGEFIREVYIAPFDISVRKVAESLQVSASTLNRLLNGESNVSPEMALRLSKALGRSPESWLSMQDQYDLWNARKKIDLRKIRKLNVSAA